MPGLPRGLRDYQNFVPHINIIIGPNASGKSSTARVIRELIWRQATGEVTANALVDFDGQEWELKLDGRRASSRRNGVEDILAGVPAWEGHYRYTLALHELVAAEDGDLARQVVRESVGYDLDAAQRALGYASGANSPRMNVYRDFKAAKDAYDEKFRGQDDLNREQGRLTRLMLEKGGADRAGALLEWNRQLLEFLRAKQSLADAQTALAAFPAVLDFLSGEEYQNLEDLREQLETLATEVKNLQNEITSAEDRRKLLNFPEVGLPSTLLHVLDDKIAKLFELEKELTEKEQDIADATAREEAALKRLGTEHGISEWDGVTFLDIDGLEAYLQKVHQLLSRKGSVEALINELERSAGAHENPPPADLLNGIDNLTGWLQDFKPEEKKKPIPDWSLWVIAALAFVPTFCVIVFGKAGLIAIIIVFVIAAIFFFLRKGGGQNVANVRRSDFQRLELPEPIEWSVAQVQKRLTELVEQLVEAKWQQRVADRVEIHKDELEAMKPELKEMRNQYDSLKDQLKLIPVAPSGDLRSFDGMYFFLRYAGEWHDCYSERVGLQNALRTIEGQRETQLAAINILFSSANVGPTDDASTAKVLLRQLEDNDRSWGSEGIVIVNAKRGVKEREPRQEQLIDKINEIFDRCAVESGEDQDVRELVAKVENYQQVKQGCRDTTTLLTEKERVLGETLLFSSQAVEMNQIDIATVEARLPAISVQASGLEQITRDIGGINAKIELAESGNSLEIALKEKEERLADLEEMYDMNLGAVTGKLLIDTLKKQADDRDRPAVFRRANTIFRRITNGKFELRLRSSEPPAFGAFDTVESEWRDLKELSTGTRIQLLLSVRLAFIDSLESSVSIPIVADELLANSDPQRASAIVDALAEISRQGRQIFYFTSQADEVEKWLGFLADKPEITQAVFVLDGLENEGYELLHMRPAEEFGGQHLLEALPEVGDRDYAQYGAVLRVGPFDVMSDQPDRLHVWYLFDDPHVVHNLLEKGLNYWGQLRSYRSVGGRLDNLDAGTVEQVTSKIAVFERFQELYRKGRPRKINRLVLENSGVISSGFMDAVTEKSEMLGHNPRDLLHALDTGEVARFQSRSVERLREYLTDKGFLSDETPLSAEEIWVQLAAFISQSLIRQEEARRFVARILGI